MAKQIIRKLCPPIVWDSLIFIKGEVLTYTRMFLKINTSFKQKENDYSSQDLDIYWTPKMAEMLETWGEGNAWKELEFLIVNCQGKVLDIACGTGKNIETISRFPQIEVYGCDISDFLIQKAVERGIIKSRLKICDATKTDYEDNQFNYAYSIGSLEHFTDEGIVQFVAEAYRITRYSSFHMIPVARSGKNEGWTKTLQSFYNNSVDWWLSKFKSSYKTVFVIDSSWQDDISIGKWFICIKDIENSIND